MSLPPQDRLLVDARVKAWVIPVEVRDVLRRVGIPQVVGSWNIARFQEGDEPVLRFPGLRPLYEIVRKVSLWNPERAYGCFGVEQESGKVFRAHAKVPDDQVTPATEFSAPRLVNTSVRAFVQSLRLEGDRYAGLFGASSAQALAQRADTPEPDDETLWAVGEKYLWEVRAADPSAFDDPQGYWRSLYQDIWEETGCRPFRLGPNLFAG